MKTVVCTVDARGAGRIVPTVVSSDMPSFERGDQMDFGQMLLAWKKGFRVCVTPTHFMESPEGPAAPDVNELQTR